MSVRDILYHPVSGRTNNLLLLILSLIPAFLLFRFPDSVFSTGIDPPLPWVFNFLIRDNLVLGKQIVFPHGPLAFLMYPLPPGSNFWLAISIHLAARIFMAYSLLKLATRKPIAYLVFAFFASFILLAFNDLLLTIIQIIVLCYLNFFERRNVTWLIPALLITPLALFIKAFVGIVCVAITVSFLAIMIYRAIIGLESWYRLFLFLIVPLGFILMWYGLYGNFAGAMAYINGIIELAADNSAAVALYPENNFWFISLALVCGLFLVILNIKNIILVKITVLIGPALFATWKYGMAREDYQHAYVLFVFIVFTAVIYNLITGKFKGINSGLSFIIVLLFYFSLQKAYYQETFRIHTNGVELLLKNSYRHHYFADTCLQKSEKNIARNRLDKEILDIIGDQTVDVYPWDYTYIAENKLNWKPRPVIQSYASYTRKLDLLNSSHFKNDSAPEFVIWEMRKITNDIHGGKLESIDGRYLLNDEPETLLTLLCNYELVATQKGAYPALVFKRRFTPLEASVDTIGKVTSGWNTWIDVPQDIAGVMRASVKLKRSTRGRIKSFLYKAEATYVYYMLENGDIRMYRIVPKNAAYGLWINPLVMNPELQKNSPAVRKIMFRCTNTDMRKPEIIINWTLVDFLQQGIPKDNNSSSAKRVNSFFGITDNTLPQNMLVSENSFDSTITNWSKPDEAKIIFQDNNRSLRLLPNDYSVAYDYPLDSLFTYGGYAAYIVRAGVWAKAKPGAKAIFVISIEEEGKPVLYKSVDIEGFLHDENTLNYVTNFSVLDAAILPRRGLTLKVYVLNSGKKDMVLDDFAVRIESR